jgi:hypothetical protein
MSDVRTVVYPVDFTPFSPAGLDLAVSLCRAFGARPGLDGEGSAAAPARHAMRSAAAHRTPRRRPPGP